jgi:hypothetical protein
MEVLCSSRMMNGFHHTTWQYIPDTRTVHSHYWAHQS